MSPVPFPVAAMALVLAAAAAIGLATGWVDPEHKQAEIASANHAPEKDPDSVRVPAAAASAEPRFDELKPQVALGREFFSRCLSIDAQLGPAFDDVRAWFRRRDIYGELSSNWSPPDYIVTAEEWSRLAAWWNENGETLYFPFLREWTEEERRFEQLVRQYEAGALESDRELIQIVYKCGAEWLRVPYDQSTRTFDLDAPLPERAPERHLEMIKALRGVLERVDLANRNGPR